MPMESNSTPSPTQKTKIDQAIDGLFAYLQRRWRLLALFILYIFFHPSFESKLVALLQSFEPSWGSFIVWCGIIVTALAYTYILCRRRYVISEGVLSWTAFLLLGWAYYRLIGVEDYVATPTRIPGICYVDFLPFCGGCMAFVVWWSHRHRTKPKQEGVNNSRLGYEVECPCTAEDEDLLGRRKEAQDLAEKIFQTDTSNAAFTLGLTAPWGAGKTSFMLAMKDYLEKQHSDETILLDFNPWMYRKAPNLTQVFFEELSRTLAPYSSALASGFTRYVDHILAKDDSAWLRLGVRLLPQGFHAKSTSEQYDFLKKEIGKLGKKIVIFIDDVDRLDSEELVELFSLIRNSSSFPKVSYILSYDKEYVASQLQGCFDQQTLRYMEKILQEEYALAQITPVHLEHELAVELGRLGPMYHSLVDDIKTSGIQLEHHLPTLRAVKHISNTLLSCRKEIEGNVCLFDWFIIELIRTQYPRLFDFMKENYMRAFDRSGDRCMVKISRDRGEDFQPETRPLSDHPKYGGIIDFTKYLSEQHEYFQIKNISLALELIVILWDRKRRVLPLQANHRDYICRYFYRTLHEEEIDEGVFREYINLPFKEIKAYIQQKHASHQWVEFCNRVRKEKVDNQIKAVNILLIFLYMGSLDRSVLWRAEIEDRINLLKKYLNEEELKTKLQYIFEYPDVSIGVLRYLSYVMEDERSITIPFTQNDLESIRENLFLRYVEGMNPFIPSDCFRLWLLCQTYIEVDPTGLRRQLQKPSICHPKMDARMKEIIESNIEKLIPCFIRKSWRDQTQYELLLPYPIWSLDESDEDKGIDYFPNFISHLDGRSSRVIKEFQDFLMRRISHGSSRIRFKFKYITPENIQRGIL